MSIVVDETLMTHFKSFLENAEFRKAGPGDELVALVEPAQLGEENKDTHVHLTLFDKEGLQSPDLAPAWTNNLESMLQPSQRVILCPVVLVMAFLECLRCFNNPDKKSVWQLLSSPDQGVFKIYL
jgi:hypothetical protein